MSTRVVEVNSIKNGSYVVIDGEPCRVVDIQHAKTGKHGHAKARIVAIGLFDGVKRTIALPTSEKIETPIIENSHDVATSRWINQCRNAILPHPMTN